MSLEKPLRDDDVVIRTDEVVMAEVDGEFIGMSVESGMCYGLDRVGSRIWAMMEEPRSIQSLCAELQRQYKVDENTCRADVLELLEELRSRGLVRLKP
jgi:hypothetical protein